MRSRPAVLLLLLAAATPAPASVPRAWRVVDFGERGRITSRLYDDLDGDGQAEILLFSGRRVAVHRLDPAAPPTVSDLPAEALCFCAGQLDGDPKDREIALLTPRGVLVAGLSGGALAVRERPLVETETLAPAGEPDAPHWRWFILDLDGDGLDDLAIPTGRGFALYHQGRAPGGEGGAWPEKPDRLLPYTPAAAFAVDPPGLGATVRGTLAIPDLLLLDFTGDGRPDPALIDGRTIRVFRAGADGRAAAEADPVIDLAPLLDPGEPLRLGIRDVTGDGRPEYLLNRRKEGVTDLYLGDAPLERPAARFKLPGWSFEPRLVDLDGDGRDDLIIPTTPEFGLTTGMSVAATGAVAVQNHVFLHTGDPQAPYRKEPDFVREVRVKVGLYVDLAGNIRATHSILVRHDEDFDGDGRKDLLIREGADEVRLFLGTKDGLFAPEPLLAARIPDPGDAAGLEAFAADFDSDGALEVALFYESRDRTRDRLVLLVPDKGE